MAFSVFGPKLRLILYFVNNYNYIPSPLRQETET